MGLVPGLETELRSVKSSPESHVLKGALVAIPTTLPLGVDPAQATVGPGAGELVKHPGRRGGRAPRGGSRAAGRGRQNAAQRAQKARLDATVGEVQGGGRPW